MMQTTRQTLITGCYRSGTEYITQLLNNHPELSATMYATNFMRYYYNKYNPIQDDYKSLLQDAQKTIKKRHNITINLREIQGYLKHQEHISYGKVYDAIMSNTFLNNKRFWAEKTQLVWRQIPDFLSMFPTGKAINIIRDPRAVLASFKKHTYAPPPLYLGAIFNCYDSMQHTHKFTRRFPKRFLTVRYEDIIFYPEKTLKQIFSFLNLSSDHDLLSEEGWTNTDGTPWIHNSAFIPDTQPFNKKQSLLRWKNNLKDWEIALCEHINHGYMLHYNFKLTNTHAKWSEHTKHPKIQHYLNLWCSGYGIQEFPTDPLEEKNWSENR